MLRLRCGNHSGFLFQPAEAFYADLKSTGLAGNSCPLEVGLFLIGSGWIIVAAEQFVSAAD